MGIDRDDGRDPVFLLERLMESCEDDLELAHEVLQDYRVSAPRGLSRMADAVETGDSVLVRLEAHSLKGSSRTIGAEALAVVCARLEAAGAGGDLSDALALLAEAGQRMHTLSYSLSAYLGDPCAATAA